MFQDVEFLPSMQKTFDLFPSTISPFTKKEGRKERKRGKELEDAERKRKIKEKERLHVYVYVCCVCLACMHQALGLIPSME